MEHRVKIILGANLVARPPYKMSLKEETKVQIMVDEYLNMGLLHLNILVFDSLVLLVKKKDGYFRTCIDYRAISKTILKHHYPMPRMNDLLDTLGGAILFDKIDLKSGYH